MHYLVNSCELVCRHSGDNWSRKILTTPKNTIILNRNSSVALCLVYIWPERTHHEQNNVS